MKHIWYSLIQNAVQLSPHERVGGFQVSDLGSWIWVSMYVLHVTGSAAHVCPPTLPPGHAVIGTKERVQ